MVEYISPIAPILMKLSSFLEEDIKTFILATGAMKKLRSDLEAIVPLIEDAERRQFGTDRALRVWLRNLKHICYNIEDAVDEWDVRILKMELERQEAERNASRLQKVRLSVLYAFRRVGLYAKISHRIKVRKEELDKIDEQTKRYIPQLQRVMAIQHNQLDQAETTPRRSNTVVPVREREKDQLVNMLLAENRPLVTPTVISIIGPGGIGKSTLAKEAYHDPRVKGVFNKRVWVWVSKHFDIGRIANEIVEAIEGRTPKVTGLNPLLEKLEKCVEGKNVLLVLDNVWIERRHNNETSIRNTNDRRSSIQLRSDTDHWFELRDSLTGAASKSKILITTRSNEVVEDLGLEATNRLSLEPLSNPESEKLFEAIALDGREVVTEELRITGKKIAFKCKGFPLAINCLAELCRRRPDNYWDTILESPMWRQEVVEQEVFRPLMISYCNLEPFVRRCLLYCAMCPKGSKIEKEELIKLWMAQGFLHPRGDETEETVGSGYFNYLKAHHFFEESNSGAYKMHDIVHDFITYLSVEAEEYFTLEENSTNGITIGYKERVRHFLLWLKRVERSPSRIYECKRLRSLILKWYIHPASLNPDAFEEYHRIIHQACEKLCRLRTLALSNLPFPFTEGISRDICKLILLRYLDLSGTGSLSELPEDICDLINLQTLNISWCRNLEKLPDRIGDLTNLIHLLNQRTESLEYMPKGIRRLTKLQTLSEFVVANGENAASLEDLQYLTNLQGELKIRQLSYVDDNQPESQLGNLNEKTVSLVLDFENSPIDESVLKVLKAPESVQELQIHNYEGRSLSQLSLSGALKKLILHVCAGLEQLPPLGQLQSLEFLGLFYLVSVRKIGVEVLGIGGEENMDFTAFPSLQCLRINGLKRWEEWNFEIPSTSSRTIRIMPHLRFLGISDCNSLTEERVPPQIRGLESLEIFCVDEASGFLIDELLAGRST